MHIDLESEDEEVPYVRHEALPVPAMQKDTQTRNDILLFKGNSDMPIQPAMLIELDDAFRAFLETTVIDTDCLRIRTDILTPFDSPSEKLTDMFRDIPMGYNVVLPSGEIGRYIKKAKGNKCICIINGEKQYCASEDVKGVVPKWTRNDGWQEDFVVFSSEDSKYIWKKKSEFSVWMYSRRHPRYMKNANSSFLVKQVTKRTNKRLYTHAFYMPT